MPAPVGSAYLDIKPDLSSLTKELGAFFAGSKWASIGSKAAIGLGGIAVAAGTAGKALYDIGQQFDDAYDKIRTTTGATGKQLGKLEVSFKNVISSVPVDFDTAATAVAGFNQTLDEGGKPLQKLSKQVSALVKITGADMKESVTDISRLFGDWSISTKHQTDRLDELYRLTEVTGINFNDLSQLMVQFGSPLRQLGFKFDESAAMFARFQKEGVNMQTLLPGLRMALKNIAVPTDDLAAMFKKLGISTKDPHEALMEIFKTISSDKVKEADRTLLASSVFGGRAWADMKAAVEEGRFSFDELINHMKNGKDSIRESERSTRDFSEQWTLFKNRVMVWLEPLATKVFGGLSSAMQDVNRALQGKGGFADAIKSVVDSLKNFWNESKITRDVVAAVWHSIVAIFEGAKQAIKGVVEIISGILTGDFGRAWRGVKDIFGGALHAVVGIVKGFAQPLGDAASAVGNAISGAFHAAWDTIKSVFQSGVNVLIDFINLIIKAINFIPGIPDIGLIGHVGGDDKPEHHARGGKITAPTAIVGEEAPKHPEFVIATNPAYRKRNVGLFAQAGRALGIPGFAQGGIALAGAGVRRNYPMLSGDTDFIPALGQALSAMAEATRQAIFVSSGFRTYAEQAALYATKPAGMAAAPGTSNHERGFAADIAPGFGTFGGVASKFGLGFPLLGIGEPWHVELANAGATPTGAAGFLGLSASDLISKLPNPSSLPKWMHGLGSYLVSHASAYIRDKVQNLVQGAAHAVTSGMTRTIGDWHGINSPSEFIPFWNQLNPDVSWAARAFSMIVPRESGWNPTADNGNHAGWYQFDAPTWSDFAPSGAPGYPTGPYDPAIATQAAGNVARREGRAGIMSRWAQTFQGFRQGGIIPWFGRGADFVARRPQLIGVGDGGPERVRVTPAAGGGRRRRMELVITNWHDGTGYFREIAADEADDAVAWHG